MSEPIRAGQDGTGIYYLSRCPAVEKIYKNEKTLSPGCGSAARSKPGRRCHRHRAYRSARSWMVACRFNQPAGYQRGRAGLGTLREPTHY